MSLTEDRIDRITGSRIAGILGLSPYSTRESVLREMVRQHHGADPEFTGNAATEYGNDNEDLAVTMYEDRYGVMCEQHDTKVHPTIDYLAHTPDGLVGDDGMVEVKCPWRATYRTIAERPDYEAQIRLGLEVFDRDWCDFVVFVDGDIHDSRVHRDPEWLSSVERDLLDFMEDYQTALAEPAVHLEPLKDQRTDDEWTAAAQAWLEAHYVAERAKEALDKARQDLINLAPEKSAMGAGVQVVHGKGRKATDWKRLVADQKLDVPDEYVTVGAPTISVRRAAS